MKAYTIIALRPCRKVFVPVGSIVPRGVLQNHYTDVIAYSSHGNSPVYSSLRGWFFYKPVTWREYFRNRAETIVVS